MGEIRHNRSAHNATQPLCVACKSTQDSRTSLTHATAITSTRVIYTVWHVDSKQRPGTVCVLHAEHHLDSHRDIWSAQFWVVFTHCPVETMAGRFFFIFLHSKFMIIQGISELRKGFRSWNVYVTRNLCKSELTQYLFIYHTLSVTCTVLRYQCTRLKCYLYQFFHMEDTM
jgi:hypothetical protein